MSRPISGSFVGPDGTALAGTMTLTAKSNDSSSGLPKGASFDITLSAGAYSDDIEAGVYEVDWLEAGKKTVRLGTATVTTSTTSSDILSLIT